MPSYYVPAQDELPSSSTERVVLPGGEDYVLEVLEITETTKNDFNGKPADVFTVKFGVQKFADGAPLEDTEGNKVTTTPWVWKDIDPSRMGFKTDGTPSLARQFFCAVNGIADATQRVPEGDTEDLIGRTLIGTLTVYKKKDGNFGNKVTVFKTPSRRRRAAAQAPVEPEQDDEIDPSYLKAVASLVNDEDDPSEEVQAEVERKLKGGKKSKDGMPF